ncbi:MAG: DUF2723 domain-containing protein [candidate division FCPU426 bacterium]
MYAPSRPERVDQTIFFLKPDGWFGLLAFFLPLLTSWPWLATSSWAGGQAEWVLGASTLGVVRFPGYPLYLLSAKFLSVVLPLGEELWRYRLLSLLFGSGTCLFVYLIARRLLFPPFVSLATALSCFWFFPVWQAGLRIGPMSFHLWLLAVGVYLTLGLLTPGRHPVSVWRLTAWAALLGATASQSLGLLPWAASALLLGLVLGLPRQRVQAWMYGQAVAAALVGALLPYLYLPLRLTADHVFINTDHFQPLGPALNLHAWQGFLTQLQSHGSPPAAPQGPWSTVWSVWLRHFPVFSWALAGLGLAANLRRLFLKTPLRVTEEINLPGRQFLALLIVCSLAGLLLLPLRQSEDVMLGLAMAGPWLGLEALQYVLTVLGQGDHRLSLGMRLKPTWIGMSLVALAPVLMLLQGWPEAASGPRISDVDEVGRGMKSLPESAIVVFPDMQQGLLPLLLQTRKGVRPDLLLQPLSKPWPAAAGARAAEKGKAWRKWAAWNRELGQQVSAGKPVVVLARPKLSSPAWEYFLQSFRLLAMEDGGYLVNGPDGTNRRFSAYHVEPFPVARGPVWGESGLGPAKTPSPLETAGPMRLVAAGVQPPAASEGLDSVLTVSLRWQFLPAPNGEQWVVYFWIQPSVSGTLRRPWKAVRRLGYWPPPSWAYAPGNLEEIYQLAVPPGLPAGRYQVNLKVAPMGSARRSRSPLQVTRTPRYFPACEFTVVAPGSTAAPSNRPIVVPGK